MLSCIVLNSPNALKQLNSTVRRASRWTPLPPRLGLCVLPLTAPVAALSSHSCSSPRSILHLSSRTTSFVRLRDGGGGARPPNHQDQQPCRPTGKLLLSWVERHGESIRDKGQQKYGVRWSQAQSNLQS